MWAEYLIIDLETKESVEMWRKKTMMAPALVFISILLLCCPWRCLGSLIATSGTEGKVLELDESNFDSSISNFDFILVDFYAPWCTHCQRLSPQLDIAAPLLAILKQPVLIAKVNADKFKNLAKKYEIDAYPTLKLFIRGVPEDYYGPRDADLLVRNMKKFVAPDVSVLESASAIIQFVESAGPFFPIYIGFGLDESLISKLAVKYKKKAWFSVVKDFSEDVRELYDFEKVPALVSLLPSYGNEKSIFYGPFEEEALEGFIKRSLLPLALPINDESLHLLKDDERKIALTIVDDEYDEKPKNLIKLVKVAASANPDLVFGYVGVKQWADFADTFREDKTMPLPMMVIWDGEDDYFSVIGSESITEQDQASQITKFLQGYREGRTIQKKITGASFLNYIYLVIGAVVLYIILFAAVVLLFIRKCRNEENEPSRVGTQDQVVTHAISSGKIKEHKIGGKED